MKGELRLPFFVCLDCTRSEDNITALDTGLTVDLSASIRPGSPMRQAKNNANLVQILSVDCDPALHDHIFAPP